MTVTRRITHFAHNIIIMSEIALILHGLVTSNEGDACGL